MDTKPRIIVRNKLDNSRENSSRCFPHIYFIEKVTTNSINNKLKKHKPCLQAVLQIIQSELQVTYSFLSRNCQGFLDFS